MATGGTKSRLLRRLLADRRGSVYAMMAASVIPITGMIGGGVDFGRAYLVNSKLQMAVDAAAIAGVRAQQVDPATGDTSETWRTVDKYLRANFPNEYMGYSSSTRQIAVARQDTRITVKLDVTGQMPTTFLKIMGIGTLPVTARATAEVGERTNAIEALLVLDNTGSMKGSRMTSMKAAAVDFVNIIYANQNTANDVAIGVLPYNIVVNVGRLLQASHPTWIDDYGNPYIASGYETAPTEPLSWKGCLFASETKVSLSADVNVLDADVFDIGKTMPGERTAAGTKDMPKFKPYVYPSIWVHSFDDVDNRYKFSSNDAISDEAVNAMSHVRKALYDRYGDTICVPGQSGPACQITVTRIPDYGDYKNIKLYGHKTGQSLTGPSPNYECPSAALPLAYDRTRTEMVNYINNENAALDNIGTIHTPAMTWAYRLLARNDVFTRSTPTNKSVKRVMIFMTDGNFDSRDDGRADNKAAPFDTAWTAYGTYEDRLVTTGTTKEAFLDAMPLRFSKTCQAAKRDGIEIYTIAFALNNDAAGNKTRTMFRQCATDPNTHFFSVADGTSLKSAFRSIAADLVDLHLSR